MFELQRQPQDLRAGWSPATCEKVSTAFTGMVSTTFGEESQEAGRFSFFSNRPGTPRIKILYWDGAACGFLTTNDWSAGSFSWPPGCRRRECQAKKLTPEAFAMLQRIGSGFTRS